MTEQEFAISIVLVALPAVLAILIQFGYRVLSLGDWAAAPEVFLREVLISGTTAVLMPIVLRRVLKSNIPETVPA